MDYNDTPPGIRGHRAFDLVFSVDSSGRWDRHGEPIPMVAGCPDIDLGFTPAWIRGALPELVEGGMTHGQVVATLLIIGAVIIGCDDPTTTVIGGTGTVRDSADQVIYGVRAALTDAGLRRGELTADSMLSLEAATRFELRGIRARFTSTLGRPLGLLTAGEGTFWLNRSTLETRGTVTIVSDTSGRRIEGAWVRYDTRENQLASDSAFVATGGTRRLTGVGFTSDPGLFTIKCTSQCSGSLRP